MIYRNIGSTGMSASVIGLGAEHLDGRPYEDAQLVIDAALEQGINIIDVFMPGTPVRENIAKALRGRRNDVMIQGHIGSVDLREQYDRTRDVKACQTYFENLLRIFKTDYIDFGMMFFIDTEEDYKGVFETGYIDYVRRLKEEGKIRAIGASSHNPKMAARLVETGEIELLMFSINLAFDMLPASYDALQTLGGQIDPNLFNGIDPERKKLYDLCESKNVAITVMKTLGAGRLLSDEHTPFERPMTVAQCIHYALTRPAVVSALIGCKTADQVLEAVRYLDLSDDERDYTHAVNGLSDTMHGKCVYCNHCQPCPSGINIATLTKYLDIARLDTANIPPSIRQHYHSLEHTADDCIACGDCTKRCPFGVDVIANMDQAKKIL